MKDIDSIVKFFSLRLISPSGNGEYGLVISPTQISFIKTKAFNSTLARIVPTSMMLAGLLLNGFLWAIIGAVIGWSVYYVYKKNHQREFESRIEHVLKAPEQYQRTDDIERLTVSDIKKIRLEYVLTSYFLYLPGIIPEPGGFIIRNRRDYEEIKKLVMGFSPAIEVCAD